MSDSCPSNLAISFLLFVKGTHILYYTVFVCCAVECNASFPVGIVVLEKDRLVFFNGKCRKIPSLIIRETFTCPCENDNGGLVYI